MLAALRATHEHLDLEVLDALTRDAASLPALLTELAAAREEELEGPGALLRGQVVVSTCNRLEIYLDTDRFHDSIALVLDAVAATSSLPREQVAACFDAAVDTPVAEHLYAVTSGLRSLVIGEAEIAGQVRHAYETARAQGRTSTLLHDLFQHAFRCGKAVTTQAPVGAAGRSGAAIALDLAATQLGGLTDARVLVIGTGAYARLGVAELQRRGVTPAQIAVISLSGREETFAASHGITPIPAAQLGTAARAADLIIACSGHGTVLHPEHLEGASRTVVLDLALHSDVHPGVADLAGVSVLGLADLRRELPPTDQAAYAQAQQIVAEHVAAFTARCEARRLDPATAALRQKVAEAAQAEIDRLHRDAAAETAAQVERSVRRILARVLHEPAQHARRIAAEGGAEQYAQAFHTVFGIDITAAAPPGTARTGAEHTGSEQQWMRADRTVPPVLAMTEAETSQR